MDDNKRETYEALKDPKPGDRFHEFYSWWMYVVDVGRTHVTTLTASPPCTLPDDGKAERMTRKDFLRRYCYDTMPDTPWLRLCDRGTDVSGWLDGKVVESVPVARKTSARKICLRKEN
jgi:hypothetical protein